MKAFFFFRCQDDRESCGAEQSEVGDLTVLCSTDSSVSLLSFRLDYFKFARLLCAKKNKNLHYNFCFLSYSDALHSLDNITFYLLQTLNGHGYRCLGNEKMQSSFCFQPFLFYYFMFDKLENNVLLYMIISISIYIFTQIYI